MHVKFEMSKDYLYGNIRKAVANLSLRVERCLSW